MPRNLICSFCGREFRHGIGLTFVKRDGGLRYFCSSKCRKSVLEFNRDARKIKWTEHYGKKERGV